MENRLVTIFQDTQKLLWENEQIFHLTASWINQKCPGQKFSRSILIFSFKTSLFYVSFR